MGVARSEQRAAAGAIALLTLMKRNSQRSNLELSRENKRETFVSDTRTDDVVRRSFPESVTYWPVSRIIPDRVSGQGAAVGRVRLSSVCFHLRV